MLNILNHFEWNTLGKNSGLIQTRKNKQKDCIQRKNICPFSFLPRNDVTEWLTFWEIQAVTNWSLRNERAPLRTTFFGQDSRFREIGGKVDICGLLSRKCHEQLSGNTSLTRIVTSSKRSVLTEISTFIDRLIFAWPREAAEISRYHSNVPRDFPPTFSLRGGA